MNVASYYWGISNIIVQITVIELCFERSVVYKQHLKSDLLWRAEVSKTSSV